MKIWLYNPTTFTYSASKGLHQIANPTLKRIVEMFRNHEDQFSHELSIRSVSYANGKMWVGVEGSSAEGITVYHAFDEDSLKLLDDVNKLSEKIAKKLHDMKFLVVLLRTSNRPPSSAAGLNVAQITGELWDIHNNIASWGNYSNSSGGYTNEVSQHEKEVSEKIEELESYMKVLDEIYDTASTIAKFECDKKEYEMFLGHWINTVATQNARDKAIIKEVQKAFGRMK